MNKSYIILLLLLNTLALHASDQLFSDLDDPTKTLQQGIDGLCTDCSPNNQNSIIGDENNLKDDNDPSCNLQLGWGHGRGAHNVMRSKLNTECIGGIGMGCNAGKSNIGVVSGDYARFQAGTNGTYLNYSFQGTQNGGLNPVILEEGASQKLFNHNSYLGFMRMTQYHWLQLVNFSHDQLLNKTCRRVKIKFTCHALDLNDTELNKRLNAFKNKNTFFDKTSDISKFNEDIQILKRFQPLDKCFHDEKIVSLPKSCNDSITISPQSKILPHCQEWVNNIKTIKQHDFNTDNKLPKSQQNQYPPTGALN